MKISAVATARYAIARTANYYGVKVREIIGPGRRRTPAEARAVAAWCARRCGLSYPEIGVLFGRRHHTTMMRAVARGQAIVQELL